MTNVRSWNDRIRAELRKQWWQTLTVILALALGAGLWIAFTSGDDSAAAQLPACDQGNDCRVLLAVKAQLQGTATNALNWRADLAMASWTGVKLTDGRVTQLDLANKKLAGTLPAKLSELTKLEHLYLDGNAPTGGIPKEWGAFPRLFLLSASRNTLTGAIPAELGSAPRLFSLALSDNTLTGSIPAELGTAPRLGTLILERNKLTGSLPASLKRLQVLWVKGNAFTGCLPPELRTIATNDLATLKLKDCPKATPTPATLDPVGTLTASELTNASVRVSWPAVAVAKSYEVRYWDKARKKATIKKVTIPATAAEYVVKGLTATRTYVIRVFVHDGASLRTDKASPPLTVTIPKETPKPTATPTPTSHTLTVTQAENGNLGATPGGPYTSDINTVVVVTATPDQGYELTAWGGDCATTPKTSTTCVVTMSASRSVTATFGRAKPPPLRGPLTLTVISKGDADALTLEWTGGPSNADRWQYRTRMWVGSNAQAWGSWTNVPNSGALTSSYRLTGLRVNGAYGAYELQVRPVVGSTAGTASNVGRGVTHKKGSAPRIYSDQIVEGDGKKQWRVHSLGWVVTIPDGMRLRGGRGWVSEDGGFGVTLYDHASGSSIAFNAWGYEVGRNIATGGQNAELNPNRDVEKLFDQIVDSVRQKQ